MFLLIFGEKINPNFGQLQKISMSWFADKGFFLYNHFMIFDIVVLENTSIFDQLILEESLLRGSSRNFCLVNTGSSPAVVMGISGKMEELVHIKNVKDLGYPVIRRFSGGGTVIVDPNTVFVSFICNKKDFTFHGYPEQILRWSEKIFIDAFSIEGFRLQENDFVIGALKCGGNAQYITKDRWIQHTSFLWDFCPNNMACLLHPPKTPLYREGREHKDFLCTLQRHFSSKEEIFRSIFASLSLDHILTWGDKNFLPIGLGRISTEYIDLP